MKVEMSNSAFKFLRNLEIDEQNKIRIKINLLVSFLDNGIIPVRELSIKKLKGNWYPYKRIRIGDYRMIFNYDITVKLLKIIVIDNRKNLY